KKFSIENDLKVGELNPCVRVAHINKKGSAVAIIVFGVVIAAFTVLQVSQNFDSVFTPLRTDEQTLVSEAVSLTNALIKQALNEAQIQGFHGQQPLWYCNYPYPPTKNEVLINMSKYIYERVNIGLQRYPRADLQIDKIEIADFSNTDEPVKISGGNLSISVSQGGLSFTTKVPIEFEYPWKTWEMYTRMYEWVEDDAGQLMEEVRKKLEKPCQMLKYDCTCPSLDNFHASQHEINSLKITSQDMREVLNEVLDNLTSKFDPNEIECSYSIREGSRINEMLNFTYKTASLDEPFPSAPNPYRIDRGDENYFMNLKSIMERANCPTYRDQIDSDEQQAIVETDLRFKTEDRVSFSASATCTGSLTDMSGEIEQLSLNRFITYDVRFTCQDKNSYITGSTGIENVKASVELAVHVADLCENPDYSNHVGQLKIFACEDGEAEVPMACTKECPPCQQCEFTSEIINYYDIDDPEDLIARGFTIEYNSAGKMYAVPPEHYMICIDQPDANTCRPYFFDIELGEFRYEDDDGHNYTCGTCEFDEELGHKTCEPVEKYRQNCEFYMEDTGESCLLCDGENVAGAEACQPGGEGVALERGMLCRATQEEIDAGIGRGFCSLCNYDGECDNIGNFTEAIEKINQRRIDEGQSLVTEGIITSNLCPICQVCGNNGSIVECIPDLSGDINEKIIENMTCKVCRDGYPDYAIAGTNHPNCGRCEVCIGDETNICGYVPDYTEERGGCPSCQTCGTLDGETAQCIPDSEQEGLQCNPFSGGGHQICNTCQDGVCKGNEANVGVQCNSNFECRTQCSIRPDGLGRCEDGSHTEGNVCYNPNLIPDNLPCYDKMRCSSVGRCNLVAPDEDAICCGDEVGLSGDICCTLLNGTQFFTGGIPCADYTAG
ncbi:MAG: hypothetical protein ACMXYE_02855, partial [Candidatus Woesearchaeota archaeon]